MMSAVPSAFGAVDAGDPDPDPGGLAVGVSGGDAFAEGREVEPVSATGSSETCEGILASIRLRIWYPVHRFQNARP